MNTQSIPGITKIGYLECSKLSPQLTLKSIAGLPIAIFSDITYVTFSGEPTCEAVSSDDNNGRSEKTSLKFTTTQHIPDDVPIAFVICCANGQDYVIGAKERPFPIVKITKSTGTAKGDASSFRVEISHIAIKSLLPITV